MKNEQRSWLLSDVALFAGILLVQASTWVPWMGILGALFALAGASSQLRWSNERPKDTRLLFVEATFALGLMFFVAARSTWSPLEIVTAVIALMTLAVIAVGQVRLLRRCSRV